MINIKRKKVKIAFIGQKVNKMCEGEEKRIFVTVNGEKIILELDSSTLEFTPSRSFKIAHKHPHRIYNVPSPLGLLVVVGDVSIQGISCRTREM